MGEGLDSQGDVVSRRSPTRELLFLDIRESRVAVSKARFRSASQMEESPENVSVSPPCSRLVEAATFRVYLDVSRASPSAISSLSVQGAWRESVSL